MSVPARVKAAMQFLRDADGWPNPPPVYDGGVREPRDLTAREAAAEVAALDLLRAYFDGTIDCGDYPAIATVPAEAPE